MNTYGKSNLLRVPLFLLFISYYVLITLPLGMTLYNTLFGRNLKGDFSRDFLFQVIYDEIQYIRHRNKKRRSK